MLVEDILISKFMGEKYMQVIKYENEFGLIISFQELGKRLDISFGGNLDLYWTIYSKNESDCHDFIITKENYEVYKLFEELFDDIKNIKIYTETVIPFYIETEEERQDYLNEVEYEKSKYRLYNCSNYNELFDKENSIITWYSDETNHEVANILKIKKEKESFRLEFFIQPHKKEYDRDFNSLNYISIRFRNSGSSYEPFNVIFMRMYEKMKQIDDVSDNGHQIHMEEYLYNQSKIKKLTTVGK